MRSRTFSVRASASPGSSSGSKEASEPDSVLRRALMYASRKVRPMAIASPTLRIEVVSVRVDFGNFSKLNRGIFTTT